jgi:hypothetical protein
MTGQGPVGARRGDAASPELSTEEIATLAEIFPPRWPARSLLREAGFPLMEVPAAADTAVAFWEQIAEGIALGIFPGGRRLLLIAAAKRYPGQPVFSAGLADAPSDSRMAADDGTYGSAADGSRALTRVLVVGANPQGVERIRPDRDARAIRQAAERGHIVAEYCPAASATDLGRALEFRPDILHLACHGSAGDLIFEDAQGYEHAVAARDVEETLRLYTEVGSVRLSGVVLASCDGDQAAAELLGVADRVVAHSGPLDDDCAVVFTGLLYQELARTPDLAAAARLAARHTLLTDRSCADVVNGLLILPAAASGDG